MRATTGAGPDAARQADRRSRRWLAAALLAGLALRLCFGMAYWVGKPLTLDEQEYLLLAHNVASGQGFSYRSPSSGVVEGRHVGRAPLYPLFVAGVGLAWPGSEIVADRLPTSVPAEVKAIQALLGCAIVWLVAWWARRIAGRTAGVAAAWVAACYPPLVFISGYALSESLYAVLALLAALLIDRACAIGSPGRSGAFALASGLATGLAILTRPAFLPFLALVAAWQVIGRRGWLLIAVVAGSTIVVAPWTARNQAVYGRFVLVASEGGVTFWTGNNRLAGGEGDLAANPEMKRAALEIERAAGGATPEALEGVFYRAAVDDIRGDPVRWIGLLARKAFYTVVPAGPSYALHSARFVVASVVPYLVVLPCAGWGAWRARGRRPPPAALWLLAASAWLVCLVFFPQERFRVPVIDPVLIVYAAACGAAAWASRAGSAERT
jgi:4-amino-4-deoxy-L-arabinose transferase-like glycosyltransferase